MYSLPTGSISSELPAFPLESESRSVNFKDYFSGHSVDYARYRPTYPSALFEYLASLSPSTELAWDCATGNGQAAVSLADYFLRVIATDASADQIANSRKHDRVSYVVALAEQSGIESSSVDLVTVAQALHWFATNAFFREVKRVLKPGGVIAVWCYNLVEVEPEIDVVLRRFYSETVGPYWPPERALVEAHYSTIAFPFREISPQSFKLEADWSLADLVGFVQTWSATKRYIAVRGSDPVEAFAEVIMKLWGDTSTLKHISWPLHLRIGKRT
jgi:SAM-dependent methyltransferase